MLAEASCVASAALTSQITRPDQMAALERASRDLLDNDVRRVDRRGLAERRRVYRGVELVRESRDSSRSVGSEPC
jgi:hypothetical protein